MYSFVSNNNNGATGVELHDELGKTIVVEGSVLNNCNSAEEAEALAFLHGMHLVKEQISEPLIFESIAPQSLKLYKADATRYRT
jgi:hypothetical protein